MQVSSVADHVTHAVIGGDTNIEFGISNSAEFFDILSSTLYTDQKLAVVREVLCNANDAHVEAGISRPIVVTIADNKFTVQDFGFGIPKAMIGPIYGVYGNSTKKHDGKQTGGFGLGCKAPFAYTDHFEVTSIHGGEKTIYNMSKSSAQVDGKPGIVPIASFPAMTESGITVSLDLKEGRDHRIFIELVERIARNGEMNVELNGKLLTTIPFSTMKHDFMVTTDEVYPNSSSIVFIRYGNVIYPIPQHASFSDQYKKVEGFINRFPRISHSNTYRIVFQAPAHSISVTPSRESLSMQEHTIKTLTEIFDAFLKRMDGEMEVSSFQVMRDSIEQSVLEKKLGPIFSPREQIPNVDRNPTLTKNYWVEISRIASVFCARSYPTFKNFRKADILQRIQTLIDNNLGPRGLLQSYRAAYDKEVRTKGKEWDAGSWFHRNLVAPLIMKLPALMAPERLYVYGHGAGMKYDYSRSERIEPVQQARFAARLPMENYLPYLRNIIVLSFSRIDVDTRVRRFPQILDQAGDATGYLLYVCPRSQKRVDAAREFFTAQGMEIIDLTKAHEWELADVVVPETRDRVPAKPKKIGHPCFSAVISGMGKITVANLRDPEVARIEKPEWFARIGKTDRYGSQIEAVGRIAEAGQLAALVHLFGSKGAMVTTQIQEDKLKAQLAVDVDTYIIDKVTSYVMTSPGIAEWLPFAAHKLYGDMGRKHSSSHTAAYKVYSMAMGNELLRKELHLVKNMTKEDSWNWKLWRQMRSHAFQIQGLLGANPKYAETVAYVDAIQLDPIAHKLKSSLDQNKLLEILDISKIEEIFKTGDATKIEQIKKIVMLALQG